MSKVKLATPEMETTLPFGEHNARRRRNKVVSTPGSRNQSRKAPHAEGSTATANATLLTTYRQFAPQGVLHE